MRRLAVALLVLVVAGCGSEPTGSDAPAQVTVTDGPPPYTVSSYPDGNDTLTCVGNGWSISCVRS